MLGSDEKAEIRDLVESELDRAEKIWEQVGPDFLEGERISALSFLEKAESVPSKIPGHPLVHEGEPVVDEFIALVGDMRDSSRHLLCDIAGTKGGVTMLKRVFFETAALLPALARTVALEDGAVTEYLGDGVLALFRVNDDGMKETIYAAHRAAENCINDTRYLVNEALTSRYGLPVIDLGVGMAMSQAVVTIIGLPGARHAKALGRCVYMASKLSGGRNLLVIDSSLKAAWPVKKGGPLQFGEKKVKGVNGFAVTRKS